MINEARLQELREEVGEDDLAEVIALFCEEMDAAIQELETTPRDELPGQLHFLKGSAINIGLNEVSELCRNGELNLAKDPQSKVDLKAIRNAYSAAKCVLRTME